MRNPKRELEWAYFKHLCRKENRDITEMFYDITLFKPNGKIEDKIHGRAESLVRNAFNFIAQNMLQICPNVEGHGGYGVGSLKIKDTAAALSTTWYTHYNADLESESYGFRALASNATFGILLDGSAAAYDFEAIAPTTKIGTGNAVGYINYGDTLLPQLSYNAGTAIWTCLWDRSFTNNSGGDITVNALCLAGAVTDYSQTRSANMMFARDVLPAPFTFTDGRTAIARYTLTHEAA